MDRTALNRDKGILILQGLLHELQEISADAELSAFDSKVIQGHFSPLISLIEEFVRGCIENIEQFLAQQKRNSRTKKELNRMCALMEKEIKRWEIKKTARPADVKEIETLQRNTKDVIDILKLKVLSSKKIEVAADVQAIEGALRSSVQIFVGGKDICVKPLGSNEGEQLTTEGEIGVTQLGHHLQKTIITSSRQAEWKMEQRDRQRALARQNVGLSMLNPRSNFGKGNVSILQSQPQPNAFKRSTTLSPSHQLRSSYGGGFGQSIESAYSSTGGFNASESSVAGQIIRLEQIQERNTRNDTQISDIGMQSNASLSIEPKPIITPQKNKYLSMTSPLVRKSVGSSGGTKQVSFLIQDRRVSQSSQQSRGSSVGQQHQTPPSTAPPHSRTNLHNSSLLLIGAGAESTSSPVKVETRTIPVPAALPNPFQLSQEVLIQPVQGKSEVMLFDLQKKISRQQDTHIKFPFAFGFAQVRDLAFVCGGRVGHPFTGMALATNFALRKNCNILMLKSMYYSRGGLATTSLKNRYIFATGGSNKEYLSVCERYDINTNNWESLPSHIECRGYHTITSIQNKYVYAFCGWNGIDDLSSVERFQWGADQWEMVELIGISPLWRKRSYISSLGMIGPTGPQGKKNAAATSASTFAQEEPENQILVFGKNNGNNATFVLDTNQDGLIRIASVVLGGELPNSYYGSCSMRYGERIFTVDDKFHVWEYAGSNWKKTKL